MWISYLLTSVRKPVHRQPIHTVATRRTVPPPTDDLAFAWFVLGRKLALGRCVERILPCFELHTCIGRRPKRWTRSDSNAIRADFDRVARNRQTWIVTEHQLLRYDLILIATKSFHFLEDDLMWMNANRRHQLNQVQQHKLWKKLQYEKKRRFRP